MEQVCVFVRHKFENWLKDMHKARVFVVLHAGAYLTSKREKQRKQIFFAMVK